MASIPFDNILSIQPPQPVSAQPQAKPTNNENEESFQNHLQSNDNQSTSTDEKINRPEERPSVKDDSNNNKLRDSSTPPERADTAVENQTETPTNDSDKSDPAAENHDLTDEVEIILIANLTLHLFTDC